MLEKLPRRKQSHPDQIRTDVVSNEEPLLIEPETLILIHQKTVLQVFLSVVQTIITLRDPKQLLQFLDQNTSGGTQPRHDEVVVTSITVKPFQFPGRFTTTHTFHVLINGRKIEAPQHTIVRMRTRANTQVAGSVPIGAVVLGLIPRHGKV